MFSVFSCTILYFIPCPFQIPWEPQQVILLTKSLVNLHSSINSSGGFNSSSNSSSHQFVPSSISINKTIFVSTDLQSRQCRLASNLKHAQGQIHFNKYIQKLKRHTNCSRQVQSLKARTASKWQEVALSHSRLELTKLTGLDWTEPSNKLEIWREYWPHDLYSI